MIRVKRWMQETTSGPGGAGGTGDLVLARARRGDLHALETLFRAHQGAVYNLARRLCRSPEDAEEVLQETFLEVSRSLGRFRGDGALSAWIRRIAANKALARLRRERVRSSDSLAEAGDDDPRLADKDVQPDPAHRLDLEAALERLPSTARTVVWLHDVEGHTHEEIGALMNRTASFSKSQLARAHRKLRRWLDSTPGRRP